MKRATPQMRAFAERLIAQETRGNKSTATKTSAAFRVCEKLRPQLANLMGNTGFHALVARALTLATTEAPWLRAMQVRSDGSLEVLDELEAQVDPERITEGGIVLTAHLLGLLATFIGEDLTLQLVRESGAKLPINDLNFGKRDKR